MTKDEALKLALEALENTDRSKLFELEKTAISAITEALAQPVQPEQKPVSGNWYTAKEIDEMVRDLDIAMNGDNAAPRAALCDLMPSLINLLTVQSLSEQSIQSDMPKIGCVNHDCNDCQTRMYQHG